MLEAGLVIKLCMSKSEEGGRECKEKRVLSYVECNYTQLFSFLVELVLWCNQEDGRRGIMMMGWHNTTS